MPNNLDMMLPYKTLEVGHPHAATALGLLSPEIRKYMWESRPKFSALKTGFDGSAFPGWLRDGVSSFFQRGGQPQQMAPAQAPAQAPALPPAANNFGPPPEAAPAPTPIADLSGIGATFNEPSIPDPGGLSAMLPRAVASMGAPGVAADRTLPSREGPRRPRLADYYESGSALNSYVPPNPQQTYSPDYTDEQIINALGVDGFRALKNNREAVQGNRQPPVQNPTAQGLMPGGSTPLSQLPYEEAQQRVFSRDPEALATLAAVGGLPQRGQVEQMGSGPQRKPRFPVSGGPSYADRYKTATEELKKRQQQRGEYSQAEKDRVRDVVLANRARRRAEMDARKNLRSQRIPRGIQYAMQASLGRGGRSAQQPSFKDQIALMSLMQKAQSDYLDRNLEEKGLSAQLAQFAAQQQNARDRMMMEAAIARREAANRQQAIQAGLLGDAMGVDSSLAIEALSPAQQQAVKSAEMKDRMKAIELAARGHAPDGVDLGALIQAALTEGVPESEIQQVLDRAGEGGTIRDPEGWDLGNFISPGVLLGGLISPQNAFFAKSPQGHRMLTNPGKYFGELSKHWGY